jgi:thiopeptide-type bacteriocin biosynthesis protein
VRQVVNWIRGGDPPSPPGLADAWEARASALGGYRRQLADNPNIEQILSSLLHMHHNRIIGTDSDSEGTCRRLARQAALAWRARYADGQP